MLSKEEKKLRKKIIDKIKNATPDECRKKCDN